MTVVVTAAAEAEPIEGHDFYEGWCEGLGDAFVAAALWVVDEAAARPGSCPRLPWAPAGRDVRFRLVDRFPYQIVLELRRESVLVLAVAHTSRRPGYWRRRVD
jgi:hypothetical protein